MEKERDTSGRFTQEQTDEEILGAVRAHEPAGTSEVAEEVGLSRQAVDYRLRKLRDAGRVHSKKIGASLVWFAPTKSGREQDVTPSERTGDVSDPRPEEPAENPQEPVSETPETEDIVDEVAREKWDETDPRLDARKQAARAVLDYIGEHGSISKQEAKEEVFPENPVRDQNARTWYRKNIRPVLNEAAEYDNSARAYRLREDVDV